MKKPIKSSVWLALLLAVIYGIFSFVPYIFSNPGCGERARNTLLEIKEGFDTDTLNWNKDIPTEDWDGVTINSDGCVTNLFLVDEYLKGVISPEIGNLTSLRYLTLSGNQLTGIIPPELGNLSNLTLLSLHNSQITGPIPPELGKLTNLTTLFLHNSQLTGTIPPSLGNLTNLTTLALFNNQLTGTVPSEVRNLPNLIHSRF